MNEQVSFEVIAATVLGMAAINYLFRAVPLVVLSKIELPKVVNRWLSYIPISVMGALVASEVFTPGGILVDPIPNPAFWGAIVSGATFYKTKSFVGGSLAGMAAYLILRTII